MISYYAILLVTAHFIADFVFQSDRQAIGKSKSFTILLEHVVYYTIAVSVVLIPFLNKEQLATFALITGITHFITDAITSRITSYLWHKEKRHWFFVMIGFDQLIHYVTLFLTFNYISI